MKILITGANSGIGKAAALQFAKLNHTVLMACRSPERGQAALAEVKQLSGNANVELVALDLSQQRSIRQCAQTVLAHHPRLDVLIHNAANFDHTQKRPVLTEDGVETVFATNHLGPFLLTHLLLPALTAAAPSRILTVASQGLMTYPFLDIQFDNLNGERKFNLQDAYYHSKQAQVMFTFELAERLKPARISVQCVRVGNVGIPDERLTHLPKWLLALYHLKRKFSITPEKMAETYLWLATAPDIQPATGGYWDAPGTPARANANAYNRATQQKLWAVSAQLTHVEN